MQGANEDSIVAGCEHVFVVHRACHTRMNLPLNDTDDGSTPRERKSRHVSRNADFIFGACSGVSDLEVYHKR